MNLIQRATNISLNPKTEWPVIEQESITTAELFKTYVMPLSAIPAIAGFIGMSVFGMSIPFLGNIRTPFVGGIVSMIVSYVMGLLAVYVLSLIVNALAPNFGAEKNPEQALKVVAFAFTPAWLVGILNIIPSLHILGLLAGLYSIYVLYLGLPVLMKSPQDKAAGYTAVSVICAIVLSIVVTAVVGTVGGIGMMGTSRFGGMHQSSEATGALGDLAAMGERMEAAGKKMEKAQKSGDTQAQMSAATEVLGTALGGGTQAEVVDVAKLKALLPETVAGMKRSSFEGEKSAMGEFKISKAKAEYRDDANKNISMSLTDTGGSKMFGAMFAWGMVEQDKETDDGYEKMGKVDGRPTHERMQKASQSGEYSVLVGGRFLLELTGRNVDMASLKAAANSVGFDKLEAMKNEGLAAK
jgi:hypothetical protein